MEIKLFSISIIFYIKLLFLIYIYLALCDYVKEQRDAGRIKVVTASDLANDVQ